MVDARNRLVIGEDPPADGILRRGVLYRWKSSTPLKRPDPRPEVLEIIRRGERKLFEKYLAARAKRQAS